MTDKPPTGARLDSLSRLSASAGSSATAGAKPGLKFKPKVVARRTKEERDASAPIDRLDAAPSRSAHAKRGSATRGGRGGMRGGRALQGTHLVQAGPLASGSVLNETTQTNRGRSTTASPTPAYLSHLVKTENKPSRESTPGLESDEEENDRSKINMSKEYKFSLEESELFPVRAPRSEHISTGDDQTVKENRESSVASSSTGSGSDIEMIDSLLVKDEQVANDLESVLKQKDLDLHKKLNQLELNTTNVADDAVDDVENSEKLMNDHKTIVKEILEIDNRDDKYLMFQLPRILPEFVRPSKPETDPEVKADPESESSNEGKEEKKAKLQTEGQVGKLRVHKSGKVTIKIGNIVMDVRRGAQTNFLQEAVIIDKSEDKQSYLLGHIQDKIVVTPSFQESA